MTGLVPSAYEAALQPGDKCSVRRRGRLMVHVATIVKVWFPSEVPKCRGGALIEYRSETFGPQRSYLALDDETELVPVVNLD